MDRPHINGMPDEVLGMIFSYLTQKDVLRCVLPVCQRWQAVAQSQVLSRQLVFGGFYSDDCVYTEEALRLVEAIPNLQALSLESRSDAVELLQAAGRRCPDLRRLVVKDDIKKSCVLTAAGLLAVFRSCEQLTALSLINVDIDDSQQLCEGLGNSLSNLCKLNIMFCIWFGPAQFDAVLDAVPDMQILHTIRPCSDANVSRMARRWGSSLQVVVLSAAELSDAGVAELAGISQLRGLQLHYLESRGTGLRQLTSLTNLERFSLLRSNNLRPANIWRFFRQSRSADRLRIITLDDCFRVNDSVLMVLAAACPSVEDVYVSYCRGVTAVGVRELLRGCRRLVRLDVMGTQDSVQEVLPEIPQLAPQLRWLQMSDVTIASRQLMREKMPEMKLLPNPTYPRLEGGRCVYKFFG